MTRSATLRFRAGRAVLRGRPRPAERLRRWAWREVHSGMARQGRHVDPLETGAPPVAPDSPQRTALADALRPAAGGAVRDGVVGDLAEYYGLSPAQVVQRCLGWEDESVLEWEAAPRDTADGLADFYNTTTSWSFDLMWWGYLQAEGYTDSPTVRIAELVGRADGERARWLDLGSGTGIAAQVFASLGYRVTLADVSRPLLEFARWRLERRGCDAEYRHLPAELGESAFDIVTAIDVVAHVPDLDEFAGRLYRALVPHGLFLATIDVRRVRSRENAWHLHADLGRVRWAMVRAGLREVGTADGYLWIYQRPGAAGIDERARRVGAWLRLVSPPARAARAVATRLATLGARVTGRIGKDQHSSGSGTGATG